MKSIPLVFGLVTLLACLTACGDDDEPTASTETTYVNPVEGLTDGDVLVAVRTRTTQASPVAGIPDIEIALDVPVAIFSENGATTSAGEVSIDGQELAFVGGAYTLGTSGFTPGQASFSYGDRAWTVAGEGAVAGGTYSNSRSMPSLGTLTADQTVVRGEPYTISVASTSQADSLIYLIGTANKRVGGSTRSVTFSAAETEALPTGTSVVQAAAYNLTTQGTNSRPVYLINEDVRQLTVEIQ